MWDGGYIQTERLYNARDLGGMPTADGRTVRYGKLLRSAMLAQATESDIECLVKEHALTTIVDLRGEEEISVSPDPVIDGVRYIKNPIFPSGKLGISHEEDLHTMAGKLDSGHEQMVRVYGMLVREERAHNHFKQYIRHVLEQEDGAILCHCTAGKDRTGIAMALIEMALGVEQDVIIQDYLYTNEFSKQAMHHVMADLLLRTDDEQIITSVRDLMLAKEEYIQTFLAGMVMECGSTDAFLKERLDLDEKTKAQLRSMYLE